MLKCYILVILKVKEEKTGIEGGCVYTVENKGDNIMIYIPYIIAVVCGFVILVLLTLNIGG
jgi:cadmium resistance protein CadD (predicted permease)